MWHYVGGNEGYFMYHNHVAAKITIFICNFTRFNYRFSYRFYYSGCLKYIVHIREYFICFRKTYFCGFIGFNMAIYPIITYQIDFTGLNPGISGSFRTVDVLNSAYKGGLYIF